MIKYRKMEMYSRPKSRVLTLLLFLFLVWGCSEEGAQPELVTYDETDVTAFSATLSGQINLPDSDIDGAGFRVFYAGVGKSYFLDPDQISGNVSFRVTELLPGNPYDFSIFYIKVVDNDTLYFTNNDTRSFFTEGLSSPDIFPKSGTRGDTIRIVGNLAGFEEYTGESGFLFWKDRSSSDTLVVIDDFISVDPTTITFVIPDDDKLISVDSFVSWIFDSREIHPAHYTDLGLGFDNLFTFIQTL